MRVCRDAPPFPKGEYTQKDVSRFVNGLAGAHLDCKEKLSGVVTTLDRTTADALARAAARR